jgi:hypothetical protein
VVSETVKMAMAIRYKIFGGVIDTAETISAFS